MIVIPDKTGEVFDMPTVPFEPDRFSDAVPYYLQYGFRYSNRLIGKVAAEASVTTESRILDLGCGPGFIANAIAPIAGEVIGIDPNEKMLEAARGEATDAGVKNVTYLIGSSFDLSFVDGAFDLVTIGQAFHWMDREATLSALDDLATEDGVVTLVQYLHPKAPENLWWELFLGIRHQFSSDDTFWKERRSPDWEPDVSVLMRSAFSEVTRLGFYNRRTWTIDSIVGLALSESATTCRQLGELKFEFEQTLRNELTPFATKGRLTSIVEHSAILARRHQK